MLFKCINEGCEFLNKEINYNRHLSIIVDGVKIYKDGDRNQIVCKECCNPLKFIQPKTNGFPQIFTQTFNSLSSNEKKEVLKKREIDHQKTDKSFHEYKKYKDNGGKE